MLIIFWTISTIGVAAIVTAAHLLFEAMKHEAQAKQYRDQDEKTVEEARLIYEKTLDLLNHRSHTRQEAIKGNELFLN